MNLVKSYMWWPCWSFSWASTAEWTAIWKRLHETKMSIYNRERIQFSAFISNMPSFMAVLFNSGKVTSLLGEDLTQCFTWLRHETNDEHRQQRGYLNSALLFPTCSFMAAYDFIQAKLRLYWESVTLLSSSQFLRAKLHKLNIRHLFNTSNSCINGCYVK